jgi:hypothetical protein
MWLIFRMRELGENEALLVKQVDLYLYLLWIPISCYSSWGPAKLRQLYNLTKITMHSLQNSQHTKCVPSGILAQAYYHIYTTQNCVCVYSTYVIMGVYMCLCLFVLLHSPRCSTRCIFYLFLKSDSTACISYLMWNRVP